jgi:di/tricarboxylate transporter
VKTLLIGLAFACNLGGMMTPISSLQNTLAVSFLEKAGYTVTFGQWMAMAVPFCTVGTILVRTCYHGGFCGVTLANFRVSRFA